MGLALVDSCVLVYDPFCNLCYNLTLSIQVTEVCFCGSSSNIKEFLEIDVVG